MIDIDSIDREQVEELVAIVAAVSGCDLVHQLNLGDPRLVGSKLPCDNCIGCRADKLLERLPRR